MIDQDVFGRLKELEYENTFLRGQLGGTVLTRFQWITVVTALGNIERAALCGVRQPDSDIVAEDEDYVQTLNYIIKMCKSTLEAVSKKK